MKSKISKINGTFLQKKMAHVITTHAIQKGGFLYSHVYYQI